MGKVKLFIQRAPQLPLLTKVPGELTATEGPGRCYGHNLMTGESMDRVSLGKAPPFC